MENAVDALKIAFAVFVLVLALSVSITSFNLVKNTSDVIIYTKDETNYYDYEYSAGTTSESRIVGIETVVPTLYRYYKENFTVVFRDKTTGSDKFLQVYETNRNEKSWSSSYKEFMKKKYNGKISDSFNFKGIFSFDLDEETLRNEPWTSSMENTKKNLEAFLEGGFFDDPSNGKPYITYDQGFISQYKGKKFIETITKYNVVNTQDEQDGNENLSSSSTKEKIIIIFTLIN